MECRTLAAGVEVPVVGMGTWRTFDVADAQLASRGGIVSAALDAGATVMDSSPMYGRAERILGQALTDRRSEAFVATKVWTPSPDEGRRQIEYSLQCFGGHVELLQIHNLVAWQQHLPLLEDLKARGTIGLIGATHYSPGSFPELVRIMETGRLDAIQIPYNARHRDVEHRIMPLAQQLGLGVLVMRPLGEGALLRRVPPDAALRRYERFGVHSWPQLLLKWILSDPRVKLAIPATSRPERMAENAAAGDGPWLDGDAREEVARLFA